MHIELDVSLDPTLGCGQAHRWRKTANSWEGVLGNEVVTLTQTENGFDCSGSSDKNKLLKYFRNEDDIKQWIPKNVFQKKKELPYEDGTFERLLKIFKKIDNIFLNRNNEQHRLYNTPRKLNNFL